MRKVLVFCLTTILLLGIFQIAVSGSLSIDELYGKAGENIGKLFSGAQVSSISGMGENHYHGYEAAIGDDSSGCLIVDIALENLDTTVKTIPVVSIVTLEDDLVYDVVIDRIDMVETLEVNLELMEDFEDYGRCQKITDALFYLNTK